MSHDVRKVLPSVEIVISTPECEVLSDKHGREEVLAAIRRVLDTFRRDAGESPLAVSPTRETLLEGILQTVSDHLRRRHRPSLRKAINGAGVVLHTGLGRAVLSRAAADAVADAISGYCTLATDLESGKRGHRDHHLTELLCELTGAEGAVVVNNNAAATMLVLNTVAQGREVVLSRGQLVEIGGSFRMPDVMRTSGAVMREVGCTNKTHLRDYAAAITEETAALMRVHHSNYRILGFASEPGVGELAQLAHDRGVAMIDDIGSGALVDLSPFGISAEPLVRDSIAAGADLVCFSGDKLIGGSQAGIIVGKKAFVDRIGKNPLMRAFRVGKLTIAAMEATLKLFRRPEGLTVDHPVYRMLSLRPDQLARRARRLQQGLASQCPKGTDLAVVDGRSQVGSGSAPVETLPTKLLRIRPPGGRAAELGRQLRVGEPPVFTRVKQDAVLIDLRTVQPGEEKPLAAAVRRALERTADDE